MKTILIPVDFSKAAEKALGYVRNVFSEQPVELILINTVAANESRSDEKIHEDFRKFEGRVLKSFPLKYTFNIIKGTLLEGIQNAIHFYKPSLVIIGTSGTLLTRALVKLTDCPVLIVPEGNNRSRIRNIAYANDFNTVKVSSAFSPLMDLSQTFDAKVHIIHINKDDYAPDDNAEASIEYYLQLVDHEYASVKSEDFVKALQDYVKNQDIDVLTVLLRDHGQNNLSSSGKLIEELVSKAQIPVLSLV